MGVCFSGFNCKSIKKNKNPVVLCSHVTSSFLVRGDSTSFVWMSYSLLPPPVLTNGIGEEFCYGNRSEAPIARTDRRDGARATLTLDR